MSESDLRELKLEKIRRLEEEQLRTYEPHPQQKLFHQSSAETRGLFGGNQSGKSWGKDMEIALTIGKVHPWRKNYSGAVFARDCYQNEDVLEKVAIPTYQRILPRRRCILKGKTFEGNPRVWPGLRGGSWETAFDKQFYVLYLNDNSFIEFKTYTQAERNLQSYAGPPRHIIAHDEEPPKDAYGENLARQVTLGINILFAMTPLNYSQWLYSEIYEEAVSTEKVDVFQMSSYENPKADLDALKELEKKIVDPAERAARLHGKFTYLEGLVYKEYGEHNLYIPFWIPKEWHRSIILDPHPAKPTAVNWVAEDFDGRMYCYREADLKGDAEHVSNQISTLSGGEKIDMWLIDPSAKGQKKKWGTDDDIYDEFLKYFPLLQLANNNRLTGWDTVRRLVRQNAPGEVPMMVVSRECPTTHHQMKNYSWKKPTKTGEDRRKAEVYKKNDDHPDNLRYRAMASRYNLGGSKFKGFSMGVYGSG